MLGDLDQPLERGAARGVLPRERRAVAVHVAEHQPATHVRVVRDGEHVTARVRVQTVFFEPRPERFDGAVIDVVRRARRYACVPEDHVPMQVVAAGHARPLVAHEAREATRRGAVVGLLGRVLDRFPDERGRLPAGRCPLAAEAHAPRFVRRVLRVHEAVAELREASVEPAGEGAVARRAGRLADARLPEQLRVVGDEREVERPTQLDATGRLLLRVVGLDADRLAAGERVGVARCAARALTPGVEGVGGVHVQLAEEGPAQRVLVRAGLALLGACEAEAAGGGGRQQRESLHQYTPSSVDCGERFENGVS